MAKLHEITLYWQKAELSLKQAHDVLALGYADLAISRAYYAMFYATYALLTWQGITPKSHSGIRSVFAQHFVKTGLIEAVYSRMLSNAFDARQSSDYDVSTELTVPEAEDALQDAAQFVQRLQSYLHGQGVVI